MAGYCTVKRGFVKEMAEVTCCKHVTSVLNFAPMGKGMSVTSPLTEAWTDKIQEPTSSTSHTQNGLPRTSSLPALGLVLRNQKHRARPLGGYLTTSAQSLYSLSNIPYVRPKGRFST